MSQWDAEEEAAWSRGREARSVGAEVCTALVALTHGSHLCSKWQPRAFHQLSNVCGTYKTILLT